MNLLIIILKIILKRCSVVHLVAGVSILKNNPDHNIKELKLVTFQLLLML